ncbi:hypothetical protein A3A39_02315 [Candidatus Kaiserbacteria bacterium RIFCSPLOWO2_01_FULL_54_13]|uniref:Uncharacterized protein n=1 Tax=Candidatus Kaiserbacteria bacterium RIFCSPLOWO2_01_FULL_54_13 TaxID=1798512 RepID=A0A1F6F1A9_9BACT|nr:MAG: hypothetical protein A3A39_02315 [Candidatus Kaiserbacteria bacterium RIFCSPLOWO2_01_FULL_54_13]
MVKLAHVLIIAVAVVLVIVLQLSPFQSESEQYARDIVKQCAPEKDHAACYEQEVPRFLSTLPLESVFDVVRSVRRLDPSYQFCHVLGHKLGEAVVAEDPSRWFEILSRNPPDNLCSSGFLHGVAVARFRAEVLDDEGLEKLISARACESRNSPAGEWNPTPFEQATCYHGLGHLLFFVTDADIPKALSSCEKAVESSDFRRLCREGVFMTMYQPLEPDDFLMIERMPMKPGTTTVRYYCAQFARDENEGACLRESWPYSRAEIMSGKGIGKFCSGQPNTTEEHRCYESAFSIVGRLSLGSREKALEACGNAPEEWREACYGRVALAVIEEDALSGRAAVSMCKSTPEEYRMGCMEFIARRADFVFGDRAGRAQFCAALSTEFSALCYPVGDVN